MTKEDGSLLTNADLVSNDIISEGLKKLFPSIPIISEESPQASYETRRHWAKFFLIDPLDGTKGYIEKNGEFTVNIALVENGFPILGVVSVPIKKIVYFAHKGNGAFVRDCQGNDLCLPNIQRDKNTVRIVVGRSRPNKETKSFLDSLKKKHKRVEVLPMGSSLKICTVAAGKADIYPRFGPTNEWDTAAAHIILTEVGGQIFCPESGKTLLYNKQNFLNPHFIAQK